MIRLTALLMTAVFVLTTASSSEAKRRHHRRSRRAKKRAVINEPDLYQRIGGSKAISELVDNWVRDALADGRLNGSLGDTGKPATITKLRKDLVEEICEISDGPCKANDSKKQIDTFNLPDEKFVVFADHLVRSMDKMKIREREKNELLGRIGESRNDNGADNTESDEEDSATD